MLTIDGSMGEGGGQVLRSSLALCGACGNDCAPGVCSNRACAEACEPGAR